MKLYFKLSSKHLNYSYVYETRYLMVLLFEIRQIYKDILNMYLLLISLPLILVLSLIFTKDRGCVKSTLSNLFLTISLLSSFFITILVS